MGPDAFDSIGDDEAMQKWYIKGSIIALVALAALMDHITENPNNILMDVLQKGTNIQRYLFIGKIGLELEN